MRKRLRRGSAIPANVCCWNLLKHFSIFPVEPRFINGGFAYVRRGFKYGPQMEAGPIWSGVMFCMMGYMTVLAVLG
ncbi:hypothetical protein [Acidithiobacillus ferriphilus]|uniref:Uncharacterized protein n=1 Tax=Acidithiobacillus ferriphilus TaxID=1689834 RepID=A0ABU6FKX9_9PROT|nr:hypothetical protein [Acidithiobacillus ferriphilus]MEB8512663.1 hypothetical protein [Acidithiobacillus ferriphilus]